MGTAATPIQILIRRAARNYTAGPTIKDASTACHQFALKGIASVVCYWNSHLDSPPFVTANYLSLLDLIRDLAADSYLSVKAPAIDFDFSLLQKILTDARRIHAPVHFDAMSPDTVDRTFTLIDEARRIYSNIGCTLPGRWRRSLEDADRVVEAGLRIRVVKGEWSGTNGDETDLHSGFINVIERLVKKRARHVAVATHEVNLAAAALDRLINAGIPCELELLYGLPQTDLLKIARDRGITARIYIPYGQAGLPYRLKEAPVKPRVLAWFVRDLIRGTAV